MGHTSMARPPKESLADCWQNYATRRWVDAPLGAYYSGPVTRFILLHGTASLPRGGQQALRRLRRRLNLDPTSIAATRASLRGLIERIGAEHVDQRLKIEVEREAQLFGQGLIFFNLENWYSAPWIVRTALKLTGLYHRARRNADHVVVRRNWLTFDNLPPAFDNFTILHLTDLHADMSVDAMRHLVGIVGALQYDICVLTGDYRGKTYGPFGKSLEIIKELRAQLKGPIYGVLGNHDSIYMAPSMEAMGIRIMFNECEPIVRHGQRIFLCGVDDPHFYRADDIEKAASQIPSDAFSILLAHTPEVYDQAASAGFDLMLSGHTHGGQLCLPGGIPIKLGAVLPRSMGSGVWRHGDLVGYTSVGAGTSLLPVRLNCPPEITLHTLYGNPNSEQPGRLRRTNITTRQDTEPWYPDDERDRH
jgi:predicted MPP superfamily phosphohydrolase